MNNVHEDCSYILLNGDIKIWLKQSESFVCNSETFFYADLNLCLFGFTTYHVHTTCGCQQATLRRTMAQSIVIPALRATTRGKQGSLTVSHVTMALTRMSLAKPLAFPVPKVSTRTAQGPQSVKCACLAPTLTRQVQRIVRCARRAITTSKWQPSFAGFIYSCCTSVKVGLDWYCSGVYDSPLI